MACRDDAHTRIRELLGQAQRPLSGYAERVADTGTGEPLSDEARHTRPRDRRRRCGGRWLVSADLPADRRLRLLGRRLRLLGRRLRFLGRRGVGVVRCHRRHTDLGGGLGQGDVTVVQTIDRIITTATSPTSNRAHRLSIIVHLSGSW
jgi:hypothetical protein